MIFDITPICEDCRRRVMWGGRIMRSECHFSRGYVVYYIKNMYDDKAHPRKCEQYQTKYCEFDMEINAFCYE